MNKQSAQQDIRVLCPRCLASYLNSEQYRVHRARRGLVNKETCMICGKSNSAVDYVIERKISK